MEKLKTKNYLQKRIVHFLFNEEWYNRIKLFKIIYRYKTGTAYEMSPILKDLISADDIVFDIGANMGQYACRFNNIVSRGKGHVYSFEPVAANFRSLSNMKKYANLKSVTVNHVGVSSTPGEAIIHIPVFDNGLVVGTRATILEIDGIKHKTETISITSVDNFVAENNIQKVDFIKCDTEGNEINVLEGAKQTIQKHLPILSFEMSYKDEGYQWLLDAGYQLFYHDKHSNKLRRIKDYQSGNLIFVNNRHLGKLNGVVEN
jgi:FkbM family methyltransferase